VIKWAARGGLAEARRSHQGAARGSHAGTARQAVPSLFHADPRAGVRRAADFRRHRALLLLSGKQGCAGKPAAREGAVGRRAHRAVRAADRAAARLRGAAAARRRRPRAAAHRVPEAAARGARGHRHHADRCERTRAAFGVAPEDGRGRHRSRLVAGAGVQERAPRTDLVWAGVLPQGDRALHVDRRALGRRSGRGHGGGSEPQVHLGRDHAHQGRPEGQGLRDRQLGAPGRRSGYWSGAAQDRHGRPRAGQDRAQAGLRRCAGDAGEGSRRRKRADGVRADRAGARHADPGHQAHTARLESVHRAAGDRGLPGARCDGAAHRGAAGRGPAVLRARRRVARAQHGAPDQRAAGRRAAHRRRRPRDPDPDEDRRRARVARRPVQPHDRATARVVCGAGTKS